MRAKVLLPEAFALEGAQETHPETADSRLGRRRPRAERGDDVPKTIPRLRRGVQSAASQERLSIEVPEQQVFRTARRPPDELQRELRIAVEERDMENLRRLLPAAAQNGVAEAEVASARHIFDFEVQAALFEQLALIHSSLQELTGNPTAPHGATFEPPLHEKIAATVTSAVKSATADLLAELRAVRSQLTTGPSEEGRREKVETDGVGQSEESGVALAQFWEVGGVPVTNSEREQLQSSEDCQHTQREVAREVEGFNCSQSSVEDPQVTAREVPMEPVEPEAEQSVHLQADSDRSLGQWNRAVSIGHIATTLQEDILAANLTRDAKVYEIEPDVIRKKGENTICPRDGRIGAAYVDCLRSADEAASASFMLSYTWGYRIGDITDTLVQYCRECDADPKRMYAWMCCFCINQHRVKEKEALGEAVPLKSLRKHSETEWLALERS
ncbi:unnamed protein product [Durusdinium trenchii]